MIATAFGRAENAGACCRPAAVGSAAPSWLPFSLPADEHIEPDALDSEIDLLTRAPDDEDGKLHLLAFGRLAVLRQDGHKAPDGTARWPDREISEAAVYGRAKDTARSFDRQSYKLTHSDLTRGADLTALLPPLWYGIGKRSEITVEGG